MNRLFKKKEKKMLAKINRKSELSPTLKSFDEMFNSMLMKFDPFYSLEMPVQSRCFGRMELDINDEEVIARLPLPGCCNDKISIELENDVLTVRAEKGCCQCKDEKNKNKLISIYKKMDSLSKEYEEINEIIKTKN